jgi:hypothetical protein
VHTASKGGMQTMGTPRPRMVTWIEALPFITTCCR